MINPRTGMPLPGGMPRWGGQPPTSGPYNTLPGTATVPLPGKEGIDQLGSGMGRYMGSFKKGGRVKKTGLYKLHRGETVIPLSRLVKA